MNNNQVQHYIPQFISRKWENMAGEFAYFDKNGKRSELLEARQKRVWQNLNVNVHRYLRGCCLFQKNAKIQRKNL